MVSLHNDVILTSWFWRNSEHDSRCLQAKSMAMASSAPAESAASSPTVARKPGRPSKVLVGEGEPLVVTVEGKQDVLLTTRDDLKQCNEVLFSLHVPNRLLYEWYRKVFNRMDYLPLLNASIVDGVVAVSDDSEELSQKLYRRAGWCSCSVSFAS